MSPSGRNSKLNVIEHEELNHGREWFKYEGPVTVDTSKEGRYGDEVTSQWWIMDYERNERDDNKKYWGMYPAGRHQTISREKPVVDARSDHDDMDEPVKKFLFQYFTSKIIRAVKTYEVRPQSGEIIDGPKDLSTSGY